MRTATKLWTISLGLLFAITLGRSIMAGMPVSYPDWQDVSNPVIYLGTYTDYSGASASFYCGTGEQAGQIYCMAHALAPQRKLNKPAPQMGNLDQLRTLNPGIAGTLRSYQVRQVGAMVPPSEPGDAPANRPKLPMVAGSFLAFAPSGPGVRLADLIPSIDNPYVLGLLTAQEELQTPVLGRCTVLPSDESRSQAVTGMLMAKQFALAERFLADHPIPRTEAVWNLPDHRVLLPWLRDGFKATPDLAANSSEAMLSPVLVLLPSAQVWLKTRSRERTEQAFYDSIFTLGLDRYSLPIEVPERSMMEDFPTPEVGPFEAGDLSFAHVLKAIAPEYYHAVQSAFQHILPLPSQVAKVSVLGVEKRGEQGFIIYLDENHQITEAQWTRTEKAVFGSQASLLVWTPDRFSNEPNGKVIRYRALGEDPTVTLADLKQVMTGSSLGYLARAAQKGWGQFNWQAWQQTLEAWAKAWPDVYGNLDFSEVLKVNDTPEVIEQLQRKLPKIAAASRYVRTGDLGFCLLTIMLKNRQFSEARTFLQELPGTIAASRETYDSHGDISQDYRGGIQLYGLLIDLLEGKAPTPLGKELKQGYGVGPFKESLKVLTHFDPKPWVKMLRTAGVAITVEP